MKIIPIVLLLVACAPAPHRVCSVATLVDKGSCDSIGRNVGTEGADVALWRPTTGGTKWCRSTLDPKSPVVCSMLLPSPSEQAEMMQRAQHPTPPAPTSATGTNAGTVTPLPNPPEPPKEAPKP